MAKAKSFKGAMESTESTAALSFISRTQDEQEELELSAGNGEETKSKRLNLLIKPSLHRNMSKIAAMERVSLNQLINTVLDEYQQIHKDKIEAYNKIFGEEV